MCMSSKKSIEFNVKCAFYFTEKIPRETLFHFAARLNLSTFTALLLEKKGASSCLALRNNHNDLAETIARKHGHQSLADLIAE